MFLYACDHFLAGLYFLIVIVINRLNLLGHVNNGF